MRQIYTSPRVENVERIVALLGEAGIETRVTNHRSWAGRDYRRSSYSARTDSSEWPQVWVVKAEDQPRARALLREAGIAPAVRFRKIWRVRANRARKAGVRRWACISGWDCWESSYCSSCCTSLTCSDFRTCANALD